MDRLERMRERLRRQTEKGLILYLTAGFPNWQIFPAILERLPQWGCDGVEVGIPFSDPIADGPIIQQAMDISLRHGTSVRQVLELLGSLKDRLPIPIVLMTYLNPIHRFGLDRFARECCQAGVDGVLITDLPADEADDWIAIARSHDLATIFLLAPTSTDDRIRIVSERASGFIYCVSRKGVTGVRETLPSDLPDLVRRIRRWTDKPLFVGFGISKPDHVRSVASFREVDGVVVGSAFIRLVSTAFARGEMIGWQETEQFVRTIKAATRG